MSYVYKRMIFVIQKKNKLKYNTSATTTTIKRAKQNTCSVY